MFVIINVLKCLVLTNSSKISDSQFTITKDKEEQPKLTFMENFSFKKRLKLLVIPKVVD